jgi:hypothetical protein
MLAIMVLPFAILGEEVAVLEAESGQVAAPFVLTNGCVCQPASKELSGKGRAVYNFSLTNTGSFVLQGLVSAPAGETNSFLVNIDSEPNDPAMSWDIPGANGFTNRLVSWRGESVPGSVLIPRKIFKLSRGEHQLILRGNSGSVQLARIAILRLPAAPIGLHATGGPGS